MSECKGQITIVWEADLAGERSLLTKSIELANIGAISRKNLGDSIYNTIVESEREATRLALATAAEAKELEAKQKEIAENSTAPLDISDDKSEGEDSATDTAPSTDDIELTDEELEAATNPSNEQLELNLEPDKEPSVTELQSKISGS